MQEVRELGRRARDQARRGAPIVLLPGLFGGAWIWEHTRRCLSSQGYRVLTVPDPFALLDLGFAPIARLRSHIHEWFDQFKISGAVLCGNSLGGLVALDFAFHFPHRVEALVISGSPGLPGETKPDVTTTRTITLEHAHALAQRLCYDPSCLSNDVIEATHALLSNRKALVNIARALKAARDYDVRCILSKIDCPVLMVWGRHDRVTPVSRWEGEIRLVKHGTLHTVERCGHCPMMEQPHQFNALVLEFLRQRSQTNVPKRSTSKPASRMTGGEVGDSTKHRSSASKATPCRRRKVRKFSSS